MSGNDDQDDVPEKLRGWDPPSHAMPLANYISTRESSNRPNIMQGGQETFDTNGPHPGRPGKGGTSDASGLFAFTGPTWKSVAGEGTPMTVPNQYRAYWKNASTAYANNTGRSLDADLKENGLTPQIASKIDAAWLGYKDIGGNVLGNLPGGNKISVYDALKLNNAPEHVLRANMPPSLRNLSGDGTRSNMDNNQSDSGQIQYGGGQQGPYSNTSRMEEGNIPFQQKAEKVGLLGMLGVQTTPAERLAMMKAGFAMMGTVGNLSKTISVGGETYVDQLEKANKAQSDLATAQQTAKEAEGRGRQAVAGSNQKIFSSPAGVVMSGITPEGKTVVSTTEPPEAGAGEIPVGGKPSTAIGSQNNAPGGANPITITPEDLQKTTATDVSNPASAAPGVKSVAKTIADNFGLGTIYADDPKSVDKKALLKNAIGEKPTGFIANYDKLNDKWQQKFEGAQSAYETSRSQLPTLKNYVDTAAQSPDKGLFAQGAKAGQRTALAENALMILNTFGIDEKWLKANGYDKEAEMWKDAKNATVASQIIDKISQQYATDANARGNPAARQIEATRNSLINYQNNPEANADILANLFVGRKIVKDNYNVMNAMAKPTNYTGYNKTEAILEAVNPAANYAKDHEILKKILNAKDPKNRLNKTIDGKEHTAASALMSGELDPVQFDQLMLQRHKIHNASEYFR